MPHIMSHPWMNTGHSLPFGPAPFPNKLESADINENVVHHMVNTLKVSWSWKKYSTCCLWSSCNTIGVILEHGWGCGSYTRSL